jgi:hypothetical protein
MERFLEEAGKWLSGKDYQMLRQVSWKTGTDDLQKPILWCRYRNFDQRFQSELVRWRQSRKEGQEYKSQLFPQALVKEGNPLEIEKKLMNFRWKVLDELEREHHFDLSSCISYYIKLQMMDRLSRFDKVKGLEKFRQVTQNNQQNNSQSNTDVASQSAERTGHTNQ